MKGAERIQRKAREQFGVIVILMIPPSGGEKWRRMIKES